MTKWGVRLLLMRVSPMYRHIYFVKAVLEKAFIGLELKRFWHDAVGIRDHAIFGDDCVTFYSTGGHGFLLEARVMIRIIGLGSVLLPKQRVSSRCIFSCAGPYPRMFKAYT
jgi:hypothetical protein